MVWWVVDSRLIEVDHIWVHPTCYERLRTCSNRSRQFKAPPFASLFASTTISSILPCQRTLPPPSYSIGVLVRSSLFWVSVLVLSSGVSRHKSVASCSRENHTHEHNISYNSFFRYLRLKLACVE